MFKMYNKILIFSLSFFLIFKGLSCVYAEDTEPFRFAVMGCMHFGVSDPEDYELAVEKIKQYHPDFVLFLGGMVDPLGGQPVESLWEEFDRITERLGVPVYDITGDIRRSCSLARANLPKDKFVLMEKCFLDRYKSRFYAFEHKNNLFICLDSKKSEGIFFEDQLDFLKKTLTNASRYDNVFIATHFSPLYYGFSDWSEIISPLIKGKVKYVFSAHEHTVSLTTSSDGIKYIISGAMPVKRVPVKPAFVHFLVVDVDGKEVSVNVVPVKPIPIEEMEGFGDKMEEMRRFFGGILYEAKKRGTVDLSADHLIDSEKRKTVLPKERIIKTLRIKPGMSILDIGAGTGFFTFPIAKALKRTGKVFATETNPEMIKDIKREMEEGKYKNVIPVLISPEGLDPFYKEHSFDIILLSEVYQYLWRPEDYLRELRPSLKKTGRLYVINFRNLSDFSQVEFDFKRVMEILVSKGEDFPVFKRLNKETQLFIKNWRKSDKVPPRIRKKIIQGLNKMLSDSTLFNDLVDYYLLKETPDFEWWRILQSIVYPRDFRLTKWLAVRLYEEGILDGKRKKLTDAERKQLFKFNRIILTGIFQSETMEIMQGEAPTYLETSSVISKVEAAGFGLVREYDFLPYHYFLEFKRDF